MEKNRTIYNMFALLLFKIRWMRFQAAMRKYETQMTSL
jgi:hypothetical protein